jgi:hypothetical protein
MAVTQHPLSITTHQSPLSALPRGPIPDYQHWQGTPSVARDRYASRIRFNPITTPDAQIRTGGC